MSTKYLEAKWELLALIWVVLPEMEEKKKKHSVRLSELFLE